MDTLHQEKYAILSLNVTDNDAKVMKVFEDSRDAIVYMNELIDQNIDWNDENYFRKIHNSTNQCSIYKTNYFTEKTLIHRYFCCKYLDTC